jgi:hypothetical protein
MYTFSYLYKKNLHGAKKNIITLCLDKTDKSPQQVTSLSQGRAVDLITNITSGKGAPVQTTVGTSTVYVQHVYIAIKI